MLWLYHYDATKQNGLNCYTNPIVMQSLWLQQNGLNCCSILIVFSVPIVQTQWFWTAAKSDCPHSYNWCNTMVWMVAESPLSSQPLWLQQWFGLLQGPHCLPSHYVCNTMVLTLAESPLSSQSLRLQHNGLNSCRVAIVFPVTTVATQWFELLQSSHCLPSHYGCNTMVLTLAESPLSSQSLRLQHNGLNSCRVAIVFPVTTVATQWFELLQSSHCLPSHYGCNTMVWTLAE